MACFLKHYEVAVFSIEDARPWEDVPSLGACDELVQKQLLAAIGEARALNARRLHCIETALVRQGAATVLPRSCATTETWDACLFAVRDLERAKDVRATLSRALRLALEAKAPVEVVDGLRQCVGAEDHNIARLRALGILQDALGAPFADEPQPNAPQLSDLLSERLVDAGDVLVLEIGGVESVRGEIDREGRVVYGGNAFRTVEGLWTKRDKIAARDVREDRTPEGLGCVVHARTGHAPARFAEPALETQTAAAVSFQEDHLGCAAR